MSYFTAQNFVYWSIAFVVSYIWMQMVTRRISAMSGVNYNRPTSFTGILLMFFTWPIWFCIFLVIDLASLVFPKSFAERMGK